VWRELVVDVDHPARGYPQTLIAVPGWAQFGCALEAPREWAMRAAGPWQIAAREVIVARDGSKRFANIDYEAERLDGLTPVRTVRERTLRTASSGHPVPTRADRVVQIIVAPLSAQGFRSVPREEWSARFGAELAENCRARERWLRGSRGSGR